MKRIVITNDMLVGARCGQRKLFRQTWPDGAAVTKVNALRAAKMKLDHDWVALHLLPPALHDEYWAKCKPIDDEYWAKRKPIDDEYRAKCKPIYDEYWAKCKSIDDKYWAKRKPLYDEYWAKRKLIGDEYEAKRKPIDDEYRAKCWIMLCPLLRKALAQADGDDDGSK